MTLKITTILIFLTAIVFAQKTEFDSLTNLIDTRNENVYDFIDIHPLMSGKFDTYLKVKEDSSKYSGRYVQYIYTSRKSEIVIFNDNFHESMLEKASITDNSFPLKYGIKIGMKREEFFKRLNWLAPSDSDSISYNDGTGDTYLDVYFEKNKLFKLVFDFTQ